MKALSEATPKYKYLFEAVSNLIRSFKNGDLRSPYQTDDLPFEAILQQERDLFIPDSKFLKKVFWEARKARAILALCKGYCHFAWNEKEAFSELLGVIQHGLTDYDHEELKPFLHLTYFLLERPGGESPEQRFESVMQTLLEIARANANYYKYMEAIFEFIFKITCKIPAAREWFK